MPPLILSDSLSHIIADIHKILHIRSFEGCLTLLWAVFEQFWRLLHPYKAVVTVGRRITFSRIYAALIQNIFAKHLFIYLIFFYCRLISIFALPCLNLQQSFHSCWILNFTPIYK